MIFPSTPHNGIIITIVGVGLSIPFFTWAYILFKRQQRIVIEHSAEKVQIILGINKIPKLLRLMSKHLKNKANKMVKSHYNESEIKELGEVVKKCMRVYGVTKELPKPHKIPFTERYRKSIENRIPEDLKKQLEDKDKSWELNMRVGGILDENKYGLQTENDTRYKRLENEVNDIVAQYVGSGSEDLTNKKNDYLIRMYATYSYLLFSNYYEVLVGFLKYHGVDSITPEIESILGLKHKGVDRYLSEELEKVKVCIAQIISKRNIADGK